MTSPSLKSAQWAAAFALAAAVGPVFGQSTGTATQTVNQRNTISVLTISPLTNLSTDSVVTATIVVHTGGAPAPTSEAIQFYDNSVAVGAPQTFTGSLPGSNLLPYSQIDPAVGWSTLGSATVAAAAANGPDGSTATAAVLTLPASLSANEGVAFGVGGTAYASQAMTLSVWAKAAAATTLSLALTDDPALNANGIGTCALTTSWQRCTVTYTFPANANTGFIARLYTTQQSAASVDLWGAQVEEASAAGPYVSTIGAARPTGGQGAVFVQTLPVYAFGINAGESGYGSHSITAAYPGDSNFIGSTSNTIPVNVNKAAATISLSAIPSSPITYGTSVTFTAAASGGAGTPTGTVQLMDGATQLASATLSSGSAQFTFSGASALGGGTHALSVTYGGDTNYGSTDSSVLSFTVNKASDSVHFNLASSENPSVYGDSVTFTINVASTISAAVPTGTVSVYDNSTSASLGSFTLDSSGQATATVPLFTAGTHSLTFTYSGDSNYQ